MNFQKVARMWSLKCCLCSVDHMQRLGIYGSSCSWDILEHNQGKSFMDFKAQDNVQYIWGW